MIIRPKNLEDMRKQLSALPESSRRVVVLVGRHPNEGGPNIAKRHHEEWEKHGAVVVHIPPQWTPHGLWWNTVLKATRDQSLFIRGGILHPQMPKFNRLLHANFEEMKNLLYQQMILSQMKYIIMAAKFL